MQTTSENNETQPKNPSTGPKSEEGKAIVSRNATKFGLFSEKNCVFPGEQPEYDALTEALFTRLAPADAVEHLYATEIVRATWRLRRCASAEHALSLETLAWATRPQSTPMDPMIHGQTLDRQKSVDRARSLAYTALSKATAELRRLQNERLAAEKATQKVRPEQNTKQTQTTAPTQITKQTPPAIPTAPITKQTPRNALCPCHSGQKYKRCCGRNAPPVLNEAA